MKAVRTFEGWGLVFSLKLPDNPHPPLSFSPAYCLNFLGTPIKVFSLSDCDLKQFFQINAARDKIFEFRAPAKTSLSKARSQSFFFFFLVFLPFLGLLPRPTELPRLGVQLEL